jgi:hypothetical protein
MWVVGWGLAVATRGACLACEAVANRADSGEGALTGYALGCQGPEVADRALREMGRTQRFSLAHHGLASEARSTVCTLCYRDTGAWISFLPVGS